MSGPQQNQAEVDHAIRLHQAGRVAEAELIYRGVLQRDPNQPDALHLLGLIAHHAGHAAPAEQLMRRAIAAAPNVPLYHLNLAKVYRGAGHAAEALLCATRACDLDPRFVEAHVERSACLVALRRPSEAEVSARRAVSLRPADPQALSAVGNALAEQGRVDEAIIEYRAALAVHPQHAETLNNLGDALRRLGHYDQAEPLLRQAIELAPQVGDPHFNLALLLLARGDFVNGWAEYEWRWRQTGVQPRRFAQPAWDGADLAGRSILLYAEQGLGDVIQFIRYAPLVARQRGAGRVIVQCQPALTPLLRTVEGVTEVISADAAGARGAGTGSAGVGSAGAGAAGAGDFPAFDVHCPIASLPLHFGTTLATIPNQCPYLRIENAEARVAAWRKRLTQGDLRTGAVSGGAGATGRGSGGGGAAEAPLRVGLVWAGSAVHRNDRNRSCRLADFAPLAAVEGVRFISLQLGDAAGQLASPPAGLAIENLATELSDLSDTAALMEALDLIITVDTAPAHLAGALNRPVWVLLPLVPDFRWLLDRADSPWYPSMRLFRQPAAGDWPTVLSAVADALREVRERHGPCQ